MLKRLQSPRMFDLGDSASITKLRRASKTEFDVHGMCGSINVVDPYHDCLDMEVAPPEVARPIRPLVMRGEVLPRRPPATGNIFRIRHTRQVEVERREDAP